MLFKVALNALSKLLHQMYYTVLIESIKETLRAQGLMTDNNRGVQKWTGRHLWLRRRLDEANHRKQARSRRRRGASGKGMGVMGVALCAPR